MSESEHVLAAALIKTLGQNNTQVGLCKALYARSFQCPISCSAAWGVLGSCSFHKTRTWRFGEVKQYIPKPVIGSDVNLGGVCSEPVFPIILFRKTT